jgi:GGDEF domain-containing protein
MSAQELIVWSLALGAIAAMAATRAAEFIATPSLSRLQGVAYHFTVFLFLLIESGLASEATAVNPRLVQPAQVLAGPVCVGLSNFWIRGWLNAAQRDRLMSGVLRATALVLPLGGLACLALPPSQQLGGSAALSLGGSVATFWLAVRAGLLGDRLAPVMAAGCLLTLPAIAGLYAQALHLPMGLGAQALLALCAALSNGVTGFALWQRDRHQWQTWRADATASQLDPVTRLASGATLVHKLVKAQRRRRRSRRDGAALAIMVFDVERVIAQAGAAGANEMFIVMAARIQRQLGVVNPVGRYYDRCFVSLVETIHSPGWLRTLGLRVASSVRRPVRVSGVGGQPIEVQPDIGVGVVHLNATAASDVEDILHDAQRMAEAARGMRSRAAIMDPGTGEVVPVEQAQLGPRRRGHPGRVRHA